MIVGIAGFIGSGKSTVGDYLVNVKGFKRLAFADSLKDATAAIFGWPRSLLEGDTGESREFREKEDYYWTSRLGWKVTPRNMLQQLGTNVLRERLHNDIWVNSLLRKTIDTKGNYVITDMRFPNELEAIRGEGGVTLRVVRGPEPEWYDLAKKTNKQSYIPSLLPGYDVHKSEWALVGSHFEHVIQNDGTLDDLYRKIEEKLFTN